MMTTRTARALVLAVLLPLVLLNASAAALEVSVTQLQDMEDAESECPSVDACTLREALSTCAREAATTSNCTVLLADGWHNMTRGQMELNATGDISVAVVGRGPARSVIWGQYNAGQRWLSVDGSMAFSVSSASIRGFSSSSGGGAMLLNNTAYTEFRSVRFEDNQVVGVGTDGGGAVFADRNNLYLRWLDCVFVNNSVESSRTGGAVMLLYANLNASFEGNTTFVGNRAGDQGGAVYATRGNINLRFAGTAFVNNSALDDGGGVCLSYSNTNATFVQTHWEDNRAQSDAGAIMLDQKNDFAQIIDSAFVRNVAGDDAGAVLVNTDNNMVTIAGSSFRENSCLDNAGAVQFYSRNGGVRVMNTTFASNRAVNNGGGSHMFFANGNSTWTDCTWVGNAADHDGGGACFFEQNEQPRVYNGVFTENVAGDDGGGLHLDTENRAGRFENCSFVGNEASDNGGAVQVDDGNVRTMFSECEFTSNVCKTAGGALQFFQYSDYSVVEHSVFRNNTATSGGGLSVFNSNWLLSIRNCTWLANFARVRGGAMALYQGNAFMLIRDSLATQNVAISDGGAFSLRSDNIQITMLRCNLTGNVAGVEGGGIASALSSTRCSLRGAIISGNRAFSGGGLAFGLDDQWNVENSQVVGNNATGDGGGISMEESDLTVISNSVLLANEAGRGIGGGASVYESVLVVEESVVSVNVAQQGGGLGLFAGVAYITNTTCASNTAVISSGGGSGGGAVAALGNSALLLNLVPATIQERVRQLFNVTLQSEEHGGLTEDVIFHDNTAVAGVGGAIALSTAALTARGATLLRNTAVSGGGISAQSAVVYLVNSSLKENVALLSGGAVRLDTSASAVLLNVTASNNSAGKNGGAFQLAPFSSTSFADSLLEGNTAATNGGACHVESSNFLIADSRVLMRENHAVAGGGGGVYWDWSHVSPRFHDLQSQIQFDGNTALYGDNVATPLHSLSTPDSLRAWSGSDLPATTAIALDWYNSTVVSLSGSYVEVSVQAATGSSCRAPSLSGSIVEAFEGGLAYFDDVQIKCSPPNASTVAVFSVDTSAIETLGAEDEPITSTTTVDLRSCVLGQIDSGDECTACIEGKYSWDPGTDVSCNDCLQHSKCPGEWKIDVDEGYWRQSNFSRRVRWCPATNACEGGTDTEEQCAAGSQGPLCAVCKSGYYSRTLLSACESCSDGSRYAPLLALGCLLCIGGSAFVFLSFRRREWLAMLRQLYGRVSFRAYAKILLSYVQLVSIAPFVFSVQYSTSIQSSCALLTSTNLVFSSMVTPHCFDSSYSFYDSLLTQTCGVIAIVVVGALFFAVRLWTTTDEVKRQRLRVQGTSSFLWLTFLVFPGTSTSIFQAYACDDDFDGDKSYLKVDYSISCTSERYRSYTLFASAMVVVFPIGIMVYYFSILWSRRHRICPPIVEAIVAVVKQQDRNVVEQQGRVLVKEAGILITPRIMDLVDDVEECERILHTVQHRDIRMRLERFLVDAHRELRFHYRNQDRQLRPVRTLFEAFKPELWWMEIVDCMRRLLLSSVTVLLWPGTASQVVAAMTVCIFFLILYAWLRPFQHDAANRLVIATQWSLYVLLLVTLLIVEDIVDADNPWVGLVLVAAVLLGPVLPFVGAIWNSWSKVRMEMQTEPSNATTSTQAKNGAFAMRLLKTVTGMRESELSELADANNSFDSSAMKYASTAAVSSTPPARDPDIIRDNPITEF